MQMKLLSVALAVAVAATAAGLSACAAEPTGEIDTALDAQAPVTASEFGSGEFVIAAGEGWIPFEYRKAVEPGSALDFSKLAHRHAPAGKFGRVVAKGGHFEFELCWPSAFRPSATTPCASITTTADLSAARTGWA